MISNLMYSKSITILLFLTGFSFLFAQDHSSGIITYKKQFIGEMKNPLLKKDKLNESMAQLNYILKFKGAESLFFLEEKMETDANTNSALSKRIGGTSGKYYMDVKNKTILHETEIFSQKFLVILNDKNFFITKESKTIEGFKCFKAIFKKIEKAPNKNLKDIESIVEVWFAPELSFPFGPLDYYNLPGLILEVKTNNIILRAKKISLKKNNFDIERPCDGQELTEKEYLNTLEKIVKNLSQE
ncbi:MAG: GLPGLI family protein [Mesonia sp.]|uniref:GLPGLI family protein n=1 Tax=Mesonia sp. TaxID=1960830 RepID=UPI003F96C91E